MFQTVQALLARLRFDVLSSASDWAFVMVEADALETEHPRDCLAIATRRARADDRRYGLVLQELRRRGRRDALPLRLHRPG